MIIEAGFPYGQGQLGELGWGFGSIKKAFKKIGKSVSKIAKKTGHNLETAGKVVTSKSALPYVIGGAALVTAPFWIPALPAIGAGIATGAGAAGSAIGTGATAIGSGAAGTGVLSQFASAFLGGGSRSAPAGSMSVPGMAVPMNYASYGPPPNPDNYPLPSPMPPPVDYAAGMQLEPEKPKETGFSIKPETLLLVGAVGVGVYLLARKERR